MGTTERAAAKAAVDQVATTRRDIKELTDAWKRRHQLPRGSPAYTAALETEDGLVSRVWRRLRADDSTVSDRSTRD